MQGLINCEGFSIYVNVVKHEKHTYQWVKTFYILHPCHLAVMGDSVSKKARSILVLKNDLLSNVMSETGPNYTAGLTLTPTSEYMFMFSADRYSNTLVTLCSTIVRHSLFLANGITTVDFSGVFFVRERPHVRVLFNCFMLLFYHAEKFKSLP